MKKIYLIKSNSYYLLNDKLNELTTDINDITKIDLKEQSITDAIDDASYYGLFNEKKAIIITSVEYFGGKNLYEDDMNKIYKYLDNMDDNTILIFVCSDITKSKPSTTKVLSYGASILDLTSGKPEERLPYIKSFIEEKGIKINDNDLNELYKKTGYNLDILLTEILKISIISKNITSNDILEYSSYNEEDITFDFSNAVIAKDFKNVFELLDKLLDKGIEVSSLVGLLASSYETLFIIKSAMQDGLSDEKIMELTGFKSGRVFVNKKNSRIYTLDELKEIILNLCDVDKKIKTGSNPVYIFKEFLLSI